MGTFIVAKEETVDRSSRSLHFFGISFFIKLIKYDNKKNIDKNDKN